SLPPEVSRRCSRRAAALSPQVEDAGATSTELLAKDGAASMARPEPDARSAAAAMTAPPVSDARSAAAATTVPPVSDARSEARVKVVCSGPTHSGLVLEAVVQPAAARSTVRPAPGASPAFDWARRVGHPGAEARAAALDRSP